MRGICGKVVVSAAVGACTLASVPAAHAVAFNVTYNATNMPVGSPQRLAFTRAADFWSTRLSDPITVNLTANMVNLPGAQIGGATTQFGVDTYGAIRTALQTDAANEPDDTIVAALPATFAANVGPGRSLTQNVLTSVANARAIGLFPASDATNDADLTFDNEDFWDFDNSNGVTAGRLDFEGTVIHEIGHALGFVSSIDFGETSVRATVLDFFRFPGASVPGNAAAFTSTARELRFDSAATFSDTVRNHAFSDGNPNQASHWAEFAASNANYVGIMDPVLNFGELAPVTNADILAFDLIGYETAIPEPTTLALAALSGAALLRRRRRA